MSDSIILRPKAVEGEIIRPCEKCGASMRVDNDGFVGTCSKDCGYFRTLYHNDNAHVIDEIYAPFVVIDEVAEMPPDFYKAERIKALKSIVEGKGVVFGFSPYEDFGVCTHPRPLGYCTWCPPYGLVKP